jgi:hypothetical protein
MTKNYYRNDRKARDTQQDKELTKDTRAGSIPTEKVFGSLGKLGEWRPTNELNKAHAEIC